MKAAILQISEGSDIIGSIVEYATNNQVGVIIFSASGSVRDVTLSHPKLSLPGAFHMLSLTGTFNVTGSAASNFVVSLSGEEGQLVRGIASGKLVAASDVSLAVATTSDKPEVYSVLPGGTIQEEEEEDEEEEEEEGEEGLTDIE